MIARVLVIALACTACSDKATHENIDKWRGTEKGPAKLAAALADDSLEADLSAHAAANMIRNGRDSDVRAALDQMGSARREAVVTKLLPRLWDVARIEGEMNMPSSSAQIAAKDALVWVRKYANDAARSQINTYLIDWYCVPTFDDAKGGGRAAMGITHGEAAMRIVGPPAAKKLIDVANGVIAAPGQGKTKNKVGDTLLLALAGTCAPETVKYVLDVVRMDRGDDTLPGRAMSALYKAYVDPGGLYERCESSGALEPSIDQIVAIAKDDKMPGQVADDAVSLLSAVGPPKCMPPLVGMIALPHTNSSFKYVGSQAALRCAGIAAIPEVAHALPEGAYSQHELAGGVAGEIARLTPRDKVLAAVRQLLADKKPLARWVAVETLGIMKSTEDAPKVAAVAGGERLLGFWGESGGGKPDPTLSQRAKEVAQQLAAGPK